MSNDPLNLTDFDIAFSAMDDSALEEFFEDAVYTAAAAMEKEPELYNDTETTELSPDFVEYIPSFDPDYNEEPPHLDAEQSRYGTDLDAIWRGTNG